MTSRLLLHQLFDELFCLSQIIGVEFPRHSDGAHRIAGFRYLQQASFLIFPAQLFQVRVVLRSFSGRLYECVARKSIKYRLRAGNHAPFDQGKTVYQHEQFEAAECQEKQQAQKNGCGNGLCPKGRKFGTGDCRYF